MAYQIVARKFQEAVASTDADSPMYNFGASLYNLILQAHPKGAFETDEEIAAAFKLAHSIFILMDEAIANGFLSTEKEIEFAFGLAYDILEREIKFPTLDNTRKKYGGSSTDPELAKSYEKQPTAAEIGERVLGQSYAEFYRCFNGISDADFRAKLLGTLWEAPYSDRHYKGPNKGPMEMVDEFNMVVSFATIKDFSENDDEAFDIPLPSVPKRSKSIMSRLSQIITSPLNSRQVIINPKQDHELILEQDNKRILEIDCAWAQALAANLEPLQVDGSIANEAQADVSMGDGSPSDQVLPASASAKGLEGEKEKEVVVKMSQKSEGGSASVVQPMANSYPIVSVTNYPVSLTEEIRSTSPGLGREQGFVALKNDIDRSGDFNGKKTRWLFKSKVIALFLQCIKDSAAEEEGINRLRSLLEEVSLPEEESFQGADEINADEIKAREQLFLWRLRELQRRLNGLSPNALDEKLIIKELLALQGFSESAFLQLCFDYPQDAFGISPLVLRSKTDGKFNVFLNMNVKSATICVDNDLIRLSGVGHSIGVRDSYGRAWEGIPGSVFSRGTTHPYGGIVGLSARASNQLLQALMDYNQSPNPNLEVYGISLLNQRGNVIKARLEQAINAARAEENMALGNLRSAQDAFFENFAQGNNQLIDMGWLIEAHLLKKGDTEESLSNLQANASIPTFDMAMATILYRDLPRVLSPGASIRNFPGLIDAMLWCGDPELSQALRQALWPIIDKNPQEFEDMLEIYGSGDDTADLAQAYFDAGENEQLKKQYADRLFKVAQISCDEVLKKCEQYKIDNPSIQQLKVINVDEMTVEGKFENALQIKLLVKKIKNGDDYKAKQDVENKKESCKKRLNEIFKYPLKKINEGNWKNSNANLVVEYMDSIKDRLDSCSAEQLNELDKVLATFQDYYGFLNSICSATFDGDLLVSKSIRAVFTGMIAELVKNSGINSDSPADLGQVVKFLNFWKDARPKIQDQPIDIGNFTGDERAYHVKINKFYADAYPKALELFEAVIEIYNKYNIVFGLTGENEDLQGFIAGISVVAAQADGSPEILKFLAEVLYEESLRLGQWMEQPGNEPFSAPSNCNDILVPFYHKKLKALEAVVAANKDLQGDETIQGTIADLRQRFAQPPKDIDSLLFGIALLGALEEQIKILTAMKEGACQESLAKLKRDGAENSGDRLQIIQQRTETLRDISASLYFEGKKDALRSAFTKVESIWPQSLLDERSKWLGVTYVPGLAPESIAKNERHIEIFEKYTAILVDEISTKPQDKMPPKLEELGLVVKTHFLAKKLEEQSIEDVNLADLKRNILYSFDGGYAGKTSLMQNINEYQTNVDQKKFNEACRNALDANLQIVALYKMISGATDEDPIVIQMKKLQVSTEQEIAGGAAMGIATAEGLHKINLALINCTSQLKEKMPEDPYERALAVNARIVSLYREVSDAGEGNIVVKQMGLLQNETKSAVNSNIITSPAAAEILHNVNLELMNCTNFIAVPRGEFRLVTNPKYWQKIGDESMKAADSPHKRLASKILFGVGCVLAVGFLVGLGVVTAGIGPAIIAAVGLGVAIAVPSTIATAATGAVIGSGLLDRSCNKDIAANKADVQKINRAENALRNAIKIVPPVPEMIVRVEGDRNPTGVSVGTSHHNPMGQAVGSQDPSPLDLDVDGSDDQTKDGKRLGAEKEEREDGDGTDAKRRIDDLSDDLDSVNLLSHEEASDEEASDEEASARGGKSIAPSAENDTLLAPGQPKPKNDTPQQNVSSPVHSKKQNARGNNITNSSSFFHQVSEESVIPTSASSSLQKDNEKKLEI